jgi:hypothetical protein
LVLATPTLSLLHGQTPAKGRWVATWATAVTPRVDAAPPSQNPPAAPVPARTSDSQTLPNGAPIPTGGQSAVHFNNQTIRQIVHTSVGGSKVRVAVSNTFGTSPLVIGAAQIATRDKDSSIVLKSNRVLRFNGIPAPTIPPGATYLSDPVEMKVPDFTDLAIDLYLPTNTKEMNGPITTHPASWQTEYVSTSGNHAGVTTSLWRPRHSTAERMAWSARRRSSWPVLKSSRRDRSSASRRWAIRSPTARPPGSTRTSGGLTSWRDASRRRASALR